MDPSLPFAANSQANRLEDEYAEPFDAWQKAPTPETRSTLLTAVDPVINQAIKSYGGASTGSPMLRSRARRIALDSFSAYNPQRGSLRTHLMHRLRRLQRVGAQDAQIIPVPEQVALERQHLDEEERELRIRLGREPSSQQVADATGLSLKRIGYIRQAKPPIATGTLVAQDPSRTPASTMPGQDDAFARGWEELVYHDLGEIDQVVFDYLLGAHGQRKLTTTEIARRLGVTPSAISQRAAKIQTQLDERSTIGVM